MSENKTWAEQFVLRLKAIAEEIRYFEEFEEYERTASGYLSRYTLETLIYEEKIRENNYTLDKLTCDLWVVRDGDGCILLTYKLMPETNPLTDESDRS